jgi:hypothetical protein
LNLTEEEKFLLKQSIEDTIRGYEKQIEEAFSRPGEEDDKDRQKVIAASQELVSKYVKLKTKISTE